MSEPRGELTAALEDYLEAIYALEQRHGAARVRDIAELRGVKAASVSPAMRRLADLGLVRYSRRSSIGLTPEGEQVARRIHARHLLLERLLGDVLRLPAADVEQAACAMEHNLTPRSRERLAQLLELLEGSPEGQAFLAAFHRELEPR